MNNFSPVQAFLATALAFTAPATTPQHQADRGSFQFHQRRMLETQAEITVLLGHIARVDVVVLIPRERIAMSGRRELYPKNGNQKERR